MRPKSPPENETMDMFRNRLDNMIDMRHELMRLADQKREQLTEAA